MPNPNFKPHAPHAGNEPGDGQQRDEVSSLQEQIAQRSQHLARIALELKSELYGIDDVIDRVMESVRAWYVLPQIITRPVIVCLWGLTGTGKTQLIRSLAQKLNFYSRFVEVQMDGFSNSGDQPHARTISAALAGTIEESTQGILVLDEFQRFRTIDAQGKDVRLERYMDVWALLSDGKMPPSLSFMSELQMALADAQYQQDRSRSRRSSLDASASQDLFSDHDHDDFDDSTEEQSELGQTADLSGRARKFKLAPYHAKELKTSLKLTESVVEIMTWSTESVMGRLESFTNDPSAWGTDYSKLLIFICGNLDEMYLQTAARVEDCDTDADIFHAVTKELSVIDVKRSLLSRFKPEQIARLGNCHVIYPSFSKATFEKLILVCAQCYLDDIQKTAGLEFTLSAALLEQIYVNGVFPSQGTRPLFSSVHSILSSALVQFTLWALEQGASLGDQVHLDVKNQRVAPGRATPGGASTVLIATWNGKTCALPVFLEISDLKERGDEDFRALLAVHEAGHALVYGLLFRQSPLEIKINPATYVGGYNIFVNRKAQTALDLLNVVCVDMGGRAAERMVFGEDQVTSGSASDIKHATQTIAQFVRYSGLGDRLSRTDRVSDESDAVNTDIMPTNLVMESMMQEQLQRAQTLLSQNRALLLKIARTLQHKGEINRDELEHWLQNARTLDAGTSQDGISPFATMLDRFEKAQPRTDPERIQENASIGL